MVDRQEFREAVRNIRDDIRAVNTRLDVINGRTRANEQAIAVLQDRSNIGLKASAGIAAVVTGLAQVVRWYLSK